MAKPSQFVVETLTSASIRWQSAERREEAKRKRWLEASCGAEVGAMAMVSNKVSAVHVHVWLCEFWCWVNCLCQTRPFQHGFGHKSGAAGQGGGMSIKGHML
jgi:hypothetical protein